MFDAKNESGKIESIANDLMYEGHGVTSAESALIRELQSMTPDQLKQVQHELQNPPWFTSPPAVTIDLDSHGRADSIYVANTEENPFNYSLYDAERIKITGDGKCYGEKQYSRFNSQGRVMDYPDGFSLDPKIPAPKPYVFDADR